MAEHSTLMGGSIARRRLNCVASYALTRKVQEASMPIPDVSSTAALRGSALHAAMEMGLDAAFGPQLDTPFEYRHEDGQTYTVSLDELDSDLRVAVAAREAFVDKFLPPDAGCVEAREVRVSLPEHIAPNAFGTCDYLLYADGVLLLADYKFGFRRARAFEQLMFYAAGAVGMVIDGVRIDPERIVLGVIQPAVSPDAEVFEVTRDDLKAFLVRVHEAVKAAQAADAENNPTAGDWCQYAPCALVCPLAARAVTAVERLATMLSGVEYQPALALVPDEQEVVETITAVLERADLVELMIETARAAAFRLIDSGFDLPGWALKERQRPQHWAVPDRKVIDTLRRLDPKLGAKFLAPRTLLSPAKVDKTLKALGVEMPPRLVHRGDPTRVLVRTAKPDQRLEQAAKLAVANLNAKIEKVVET